MICYGYVIIKYTKGTMGLPVEQQPNLGLVVKFGTTNESNNNLHN